MSSHSDWSQLHNAIKDVHREQVKNQNTLKWILMAACGCVFISILNFIVTLFT